MLADLTGPALRRATVQRSVANALGAIGPDAKAAVPALRELAKIPRVRWAADLAIKKIGG